MRGLTLIKPMHWGIVHGTKRIENRTWKPPEFIRGKWIAIHGGKKFDRLYAEMIEDTMHLTEWPGEFHDTGIVGLARVTGYVTESDDPWYIRGQYGWTLDQVVDIEPVPCRGAMGLWRVPPEVAETVVQRARWAVASRPSLNPLRDAIGRVLVEGS